MTNRESKPFWQNPAVWGGCGCCLGCIAIPLIILAVFGVGVFTVAKETGPYRAAIAQVREHPLAIEKLGEPIETSWQFQGSVNTSGGKGEARYEVPISGPNARGTLSVEATKRDGEWAYDKLEIVLDQTGERLDLRPPTADQPLEAPP